MTEALAVHADTGLARPRIEVMKEQYLLVREVREQVMEKGTHYGESYPGDKKLNLLKPGADALGVAFQFTTEFEILEKDYDGGHREYRTTCLVKTRSGTLLAMGVGTCSTMESKYRWRNGERVCPGCGKPTIIKGKEEYGGGWVCFAKKGGCGAKYQTGDAQIEAQIVGKIENQDPADQWNTCLKISKKRAYVDGIITATGASDMFTQDAEDFRSTETETKPVVSPAPTAQAPATQATGSSTLFQDLYTMVSESANMDDLNAAAQSFIKSKAALSVEEIKTLAGKMNAKRDALAPKGGK